MLEIEKKKITAVSTTRHALESEASRSLRDDRNLAMSMPTELLEPADAEPTPESLLPYIIDRHEIFKNLKNFKFDRTSFAKLSKRSAIKCKIQPKRESTHSVLI